jgi:hypothetical protein
MKNNTEEKTAYQLLLEKLDDREFARQFTEEKQKEIEELIAQILMVTTGASVVQGTVEEWGHENLFKIFGVLQIRHKNFSVCDLLENLQHYLFTWTMKHSEVYREWSSALESDGDTDETQEMPNVRLAPGESLKSSDTAKQVSDLLNNTDLPEPIKDGLADGLVELFNSHINQSEFRDYEKTPEYVEKILRGYAARHSDE